MFFVAVSNLKLDFAIMNKITESHFFLTKLKLELFQMSNSHYRNCYNNLIPYAEPIMFFIYLLTSRKEISFYILSTEMLEFFFFKDFYCLSDIIASHNDSYDKLQDYLEPI